MAADSRSDRFTSSIDLNLLVVFDALVIERSVTRAARRIGITQSAMSHALERLRKTIGDPLFVRSSVGMLPTPRAMDLIEPVRRALVEVERALLPRPVPLLTSLCRTFTVAADDLGALLVTVPLYVRLCNAAPGVEPRVVRLAVDRVERMLAHGEVDVAVCELSSIRSKALLRQTVFQDCFGLVSRRPPPRGFVTYPGSPSTGGVAAPSVYTAVDLASQSDLAVALPGCLARGFMRRFNLQVVEEPEGARGTAGSGANFSLGMFWHERFARDPEHVRLRGMVAEALADP